MLKTCLSNNRIVFFFNEMRIKCNHNYVVWLRLLRLLSVNDTILNERFEEISRRGALSFYKPLNTKKFPNLRKIIVEPVLPNMRNIIVNLEDSS